MFGGLGDDALYGSTGNDRLNGEQGNDILWGGQNDDLYVWQAGHGLDTINEDKSPSGLSGYGGGYDTIQVGISAANLEILSNPANNNLYITSVADFADGVIDEGVIIENFYLGGDFVVEILITNDGFQVDMSQFLIA